MRCAPRRELSRQLDAGYITGIGTVDDRMLILIDIEALMTSGDMGLIESAPAPPPPR